MRFITRITASFIGGVISVIVGLALMSPTSLRFGEWTAPKINFADWNSSNLNFREWNLPKKFGIGTASEIVFAGKVTNSKTKEWPNDRLVIAFLKGNEVGRNITKLGEFANSELGVHDGLFVIQLDNPYKLDPSSFDKLLLHRSGSSIYYWFDELEEGSLTSLQVPTKNIQYSIKIFEGDVSTLPIALLTPNSASMRGDKQIIVSLPTSGNFRQDENVKIRNVAPKIGEEILDVNQITVPLNNCGGSSPAIQEYTQSQTFIYEYRTETTGSAGVELPLGWLTLVAELQMTYGFEQGQIDSRTMKTTLTAEAGTNQTYVITWQEVWELGTADMKVGKDNVTIPFRVRKNLIYGVDSMKKNCG